MAKLNTQVEWLTDGEKANASVLNRPLQNIVDYIDSPQGSTGSYEIELSRIDVDVSANDFVYIDTADGKFKSAINDDSIAAKVIGQYVVSDGIGSILYNGISSNESNSFNAGTEYYLSNSVAGKLTDVYYSGAIPLGTALNSTDLLINIGGNGAQEDYEGTVVTTDNIENIINALGITGSDGSSGIETTDFIATDGQTTINVEFNPSNVFIFADGVLLSSDFYTLNGLESITFDPPLNENEKIRVMSITSIRGRISEIDFDATAGQTEFEVVYNPGQVNVFVGGIKLRDNEFTAINGTSVVLNYSVSEGDWVQIITW